MRIKMTFLIVSLWMLSVSTVGARESHSLFAEILAEHVHNGFVNYQALIEDDRLETYLSQLAETDPDTIPTAKGQLAFWLNAYNAYTLKIICDNYPVKSINDLHFGGLIIGTVLKKTIWDKDFVIINGEKMTLNQIEHEIIRPVYKDPRAHFGLVCASLSCPPLRSEAFEGERLDEQLDDQARTFLSQETKNNFDSSRKIARVSKIFDWFSGDFGENDEEILLFIAKFLPDSIASSIKANPGDWKLKHTDYDWNLNEAKDNRNQQHSGGE